MRTENIEVKFTIPIPIDKPDLNGVIYTKEAIEKAINNFPTNLPIMYMDNEETDGKIIGFTGDHHIVTYDSENQVCKVEVDGRIFYGGTGCIVNEIQDGKVKDFRITTIGIST